MTKSVLIFILISSCAMAQDKSGRLQFDWDKLAAKATEKVDVNLEGPMLNMASKFLGDKGDEAKAKQVIQGLSAVYVKSFEFDKEGQYSESDVKALRSQLRSPEWSSIIDIQDKTESLTVHMKTDGKKAQGIVVIAAEPKELTVVQIIGSVDPSMLGALSGQLGIPKMEFGPGSTPKPSPSKKED
jgi:hypothetical protein